MPGAGQAVRGIARIYLAREENGRYVWQLGLATLFGLGVPMLVCLAFGHLEYGIPAGLGAYLVSLGALRGDTRGRLVQSGQIWLGNLGVTAAGVLAADSFPFRRPGESGLRAVLPRTGDRGDRRSDLRDHRTLPARPRTRLAACLTVALIAVEYFRVPHGTWVLVGIATTLRLTWGQTVERIVKRSVGTVLCASIGAALLVWSVSWPPAGLILVIAPLGGGGITRPMRGLNYGLWPLVSAPAMLLTLSLGQTHPTWIDAGDRIADNVAGAALAAAATLLLWPHREERLIPGRLTELLLAQARFLDRAATLTEGSQPEQKLHTRAGAENAQREMADSRHQLASQPRPTPQLLTELDAAVTSADQLRTQVISHVEALPAHTTDEPDALRRLAGDIRDTAASLTGLDPGHPPGAFDTIPPGITEAATSLMTHATRAAALADAAKHPRDTASSSPGPTNHERSHLPDGH
ncbi:FUSC family protein [Streptomyces sp. ZAF1911]|uniref:FUSC family protein n=1 Tax=Streptomyces sp. ZAF1911 TaxID=2944129 RepID=UPI00237C21F1|nr:FUSC family protein [Streptomyces sp. ZAF1911]MDD9381253.1 FUSC family protein [Streptomyces sp. ZAF1911]